MAEQKTAVLLPSAYRPEVLRECLTSLFDNTPHDLFDLHLSLMQDDSASYDVAKDFRFKSLVFRRPDEYQLGAIYAGWLLLKHAPGYHFYAIASDDLVYHPGWFEAAWRMMNELGDYGLVGFNDTHSNGNEYAAHFLVSRQFLIDHHGGVIFPPIYRSWWCDREISDVAMLHNCYKWAADSIVEHRNHAWGGIEHDKVYQDAEENYADDYLLYQSLKERGFPVEWEPILI